MSWLVTGGAGYIGSHVVRAFIEAGIQPVVFDDLSSGFLDFIPPEVTLVHGTLLDGPLLMRAFEEHDISGVVHLAGFKYAGVSVQKPLHTYDQNVTAMAKLLAVMQDHDVTSMVFSSSAAVFGTPDTDLVTEQTPTLPESPYGESKLIGEWLLRDQAKATTLNHTSLRYFNVVGLGLPRSLRREPAQSVPSGLRGTARRQDSADKWRRLSDSGRHLRARLHPRRRPRPRACDGRPAAGGR